MSLFPVPAFEHYWNMWNETDPSAVRDHLEQAVSEDFIFCDPLHWHVGKDALLENVLALRAEQPEYRFTIGSNIDTHHNRYRYHWNLTKGGHRLMRGFDVSTVNEAGLLQRVDGFFGDLELVE